VSERASDWRAGFELLSHRIAYLPGKLRELAAMENPPFPVDAAGARRFVATGIGSSSAHARFLSLLIEESLGLRARYAPTSSVPSLANDDDVLVVFSQGLTPNVRPLFADVSRWRHVVIVTAVRERGGDDAKARLVREIRACGASVRTIPAQDEYGTLVRVVGPLLGYLEAFRLAAAIGSAYGVASAELDVEAIGRRISAADATLEQALHRAGLGSLEPLQQGLAMLALGNYGLLATNLQHKVLEGFLLPMPPVWDLLEVAHGPLQQAFPRPLTLLALTHAGDGAERKLLDRVAAALDPSRHRIVELESSLPGAAAVFEHEALLDWLMLRWIAERRIDQMDWPARGRDRALYESDDWTPARMASTPRRIVAATSAEAMTSSELAAAVGAGRTTAVLALGSTEQHGAHLPLATDTRVAEALAERFCRLVPEALRLPTLSLGCSSEHLGFTGTLSLRPATFTALLRDVVESLRDSGFRRVFLFSAHGGNFAALAAALPDLRSRAPDLTIGAFTDLDRLTSALQDEAKRSGITPEAAGHHAGEVETSIVLAIEADLVRREKSAPGLVEPTDDPQALFYPRLRARAESGVVGDPTAADAARGRRYLERWARLLLAEYRGEKNTR
jgi:creatinine amidohydrolase